MTKVDKSKKTHVNEMTEVLQGMGQSLRRLAKVGESLLVVLEPASATPDARTTARPAKTSAPRSVGSTRSENGSSVGVFDPSKEDIISFAEASAMVPIDPCPSVSTISRWCSVGCRGVKLENVLVGGRRKTTKQAVARFLLACRQQDWAGMHGNTALYLERAMTEKEHISEQPCEDGTSGGERDQVSNRSKKSVRSSKSKSSDLDQSSPRRYRAKRRKSGR